MNYDNTDADKSFPGDDEYEKQSRRKDLLLGKKRESKKGQGRYVMFDEEDSDESSSIISEDIKSPSKMKKSKAFRFSAKKKEKEEKKDKDLRKDEKEKEKKKEDKEGRKLRLKPKKKSKHLHEEPEKDGPKEVEKPIFGVALAIAVDRNRSHDGIELPALFRDCVDYIEEHGLLCEGIYRISGVKSKVQMLRDSYNRQNTVFLEEHEPNIVASLLKTFLRELPEPVLTTSRMPKFEEASVIKNERRRLEQFSKLVSDLPTCNRLLLSWVIVHMMHVIEHQKENKMTLQNVSIVLSPTMQISHRVLNVLFSLAKQLFRDVELKRYKPPLRPTTSKWSLELPDNPAGLEEELAKQESLLNDLHHEVTGVKDANKDEQLWEVQRVVTELKRKIKFAKKAADSEKRRREKEEIRRSHADSDDVVLRLELREAPAKKQAPLPPGGTANEKVPSARLSNEVAELQAGKIQKCPAPPPADKTANEDEGTGEKAEPSESEAVIDTSVAMETVEGEEDNVKKKEDEGKEGAMVTEAENTGTDSSAQEAGVPDNLPSAPVQDEEEEEDTFEQQVEDILEKEDGDVVKESSDEEQMEDVKVKDTEGQEVKDTEGQEVTETTGQGQSVEDSEVVVPEGVVETDGTAGMDTAGEVESNEDTGEAGRTGVTELTTGVAATGVTEHTTGVTATEHTTDVATGVTEHASGVAATCVTDPTTGAAATGVTEPTTGVEATDVTDPTTGVEATSVTDVKTGVEATSVTDVKTGVEATGVEMTDEMVKIKEQEEKEAAAREEDIINRCIEDVAEFGQSREVIVMEDEVLSEEDEEVIRLQEQDSALKLEGEELLAIESELRKKIETEQSEIERLHQEITELQYLRQDSDIDDISSSSDSSYESEDEEDLQEILNQLLTENEELEKENATMCSQIHEERMICLEVKVQIGMLQQKQLESSMGSESMLERDLLLF